MRNLNLRAPDFDRISIAFHEAGHAVLSLALNGHHGYSTVSIWPDGVYWYGICRPLGPTPGAKYLPPFPATMPREWQQLAREAWSELVVSWSGAAAFRRLEGLGLDADAIRDDATAAYGDAAQAGEVARHFWPAQHIESILDRSAETAALLIQQPEIWTAIQRVADYVATRRNAHINEVETLVRRHIPNPIVCPGTDWAARLSRQGVGC
jgi:hypothetical protein